MKLKDEFNLFVNWLVNTILAGFIMLSIATIFIFMKEIAMNYASTSKICRIDIYLILISIVLIPLIWLAAKFYRKRNPISKITERIEKDFIENDFENYRDKISK